MTKPFKPLLAAAMQEPKFPYLVSPKLDGIRCIIRDGVAYSRSLKLIPNRHIQKILGDHKLSGLDGEIIVGSPTHEKAFSNTTKVVMSHDKEVDFTFYMFDDITDITKPFNERIEIVKQRLQSIDCGLRRYLALVPHAEIINQQQLDSYEAKIVSEGFEGVMLRDPQGTYKYGRSTVNQNILLKLKRFQDSEAIVVGFEELMHNDNPKEISELGNSKRATKKENKRSANTLGALQVQDLDTNVTFNVGTGFSAEQRKEIWDSQSAYLGKILTYKFFPIGVIDKPRLPVFKGWRSLGDMQ